MQEKVDLILTDPPYNILDHKIETNIDIELFLNSCKLILNDNKFLIYFGQQPTITDWNYLANKIFNYKNEVIWYKRSHSNPFAKMKKVFENIMIYAKGNNDYNNIKIPHIDILKNMAEYICQASFRKKINILENFIKKYDFNNLKKFLLNKNLFNIEKQNSKNWNFNVKRNHLSLEVDMYNLFKDGYSPQNLISFCEKKVNHSYLHPTIKPLKLISYLINLCSQENDLVFDGFSGSGSCAVACIKTNRRFIGCELDNEYFDLSCKRIETELKQGNLF